jgi:chemotaxis protein methyltransferase CheR
LSEEESRALRDLLGRQTGLSFETSGRARLHAAVEQRGQVLGCDSAADYSALLASPAGADELLILLDLVTVPETRFFRDARQFRALEQAVIPALAASRRRPGPLRLWSAACATGEEACSLAIAAMEALPGWTVEVLGTDISNRALEIARRGRYSAQRLAAVPAPLRERYFQPAGDGYEIGPVLREAVRYRWLNLAVGSLSADELGTMDVIFCENVLIYLQPAAVRRLVAGLHSVLRDDGWLFLGYSETLWQTTSAFVVQNVSGAFVYRKSPGTSAAPDAPARPHAKPARGGAALPGAQWSPRGTAPVPTKARAPRPLPSPPPGTSADLQRASQTTAARAVGTGSASVAREGPPLPAAVAPPSERLAEARALADRGELAAALAEAQRVSAESPLDARAHELLGLLAGQLGDGEAAVRALERAVYLDPAAPLAFYHLGDAYRQIGRLAEARRAYCHTLRLIERMPPGAVLGEISVELLARSCRRHLRES